MLAWLFVSVKLQICIWPSCCYCHLLSLAPVNPSFWYRITRVVPDKLHRAVIVCVCVCMLICYNIVLCVIVAQCGSCISQSFVLSADFPTLDLSTRV